MSQRTAVVPVLLAWSNLLDRGPDAPQAAALRWWRWLAAGVVAGLLFGFVAGLAKPRVRK